MRKGGEERENWNDELTLLGANLFLEQNDTNSACSMMVEAFATAHPLVVRTAEEYGFVAGLQATLGQFDHASVNFDVSIFFASSPLSLN